MQRETSRQPRGKTTPGGTPGGAARVRPKVAAAGVGGAATTVVLYALSEMLGVEVPAEVASAIAGVIAFGAGYLKPE